MVDSASNVAQMGSANERCLKMDKVRVSRETRSLWSVAEKFGRHAAVLTLGLFALLVFTACPSNSDTIDPAPVGEASPTPTLAPRTGQQIFASTCSACHGAGGEGQPNWHIPKEDGILPSPPLNGEGHTWHHPDGFLYRVVSQGGRIQEGPSVPDFKSGMPAFGDSLSHDEIIDVLIYVKGLWGDKISRSGLSIREAQEYVSGSDTFPDSGN